MRVDQDGMRPVSSGSSSTCSRARYTGRKLFDRLNLVNARTRRPSRSRSARSRRSATPPAGCRSQDSEELHLIPMIDRRDGEAAEERLRREQQGPLPAARTRRRRSPPQPAQRRSRRQPPRPRPRRAGVRLRTLEAQLRPDHAQLPRPDTAAAASPNQLTGASHDRPAPAPTSRGRAQPTACRDPRRGRARLIEHRRRHRRDPHPDRHRRSEAPGEPHADRPRLVPPRARRRCATSSASAPSLLPRALATLPGREIAEGRHHRACCASATTRPTGPTVLDGGAPAAQRRGGRVMAELPAAPTPTRDGDLSPPTRQPRATAFASISAPR